MRPGSTLWLCLLLPFLIPLPSLAAWTEGGASLVTSGNQYLLDAETDDANGTIIGWVETSVIPEQVYLQRYDPQGNPLWTAGGVLPSSTIFGKSLCKLLPTSDNGAFVAWMEWDAADPTLYLQRFTGQGVPAWTDPVALGTVRFSVNYYYLCPDGAGGIIVVWKNLLAGSHVIFAQRVDAAGALQWGAGGVQVDSIGSTATAIRGLVPSNTGSALVFWGNFEENYMQKVNAGAVVWAGARTVCANFQGLDFIFASDTQQGALIGFNEAGAVRMQRVDQDGTQLWGAAGGITLPTQGGTPELLRLVVAPQGHAWVAWQENISSLTESFLQRVNLDGSLPWGSAPTQVVSAPLWQVMPEPVVLSDGTVAITWGDARDILFLHIYQQQFNPDTGQMMFPAGGVPVSVTPTMSVEIYPYQLVPDSTGRATVFWTGIVSGERNVWGMRLNTATTLTPGNAPASVLRANETNVPALVCQLSATGWDRLTSLRVDNLGTAQAGSDILRVSLYLSDSSNFSLGAATWLADLQSVGATTWQTPGGFTSPQLDHGQYLFCTVSLSGQVTPGRTCQFSLSPQAAVFESGATLPATQFNNGTLQTLELQEALTVELTPLVTLPVHAGQQNLAFATLRLTNNRAEPLFLSKLHIVLRDAAGQTQSPANILSALGFQTVASTWTSRTTYSELQFTVPPVLTQSVPIVYTLVLGLADPNPAQSVSLCLEAQNSIFDTTGTWLALGTSQAGGFPLCTPAVAIKPKNLAQSFSNFPNPFHVSKGTRIGYYLESDSEISLTIWTLTGRKIRTLLERDLKTPGLHQEDTWDGRNAQGLPVMSGTYLLELKVKPISGSERILRRKISVVR